MTDDYVRLCHLLVRQTFLRAQGVNLRVEVSPDDTLSESSILSLESGGLTIFSS